MQILNVSIKLTAVYLFWVTGSCFLKARSGFAPQMQMQSMFLKCSQSEHAKGQLEDEASRTCLVTLSSRRWTDGVTDVSYTRTGRTVCAQDRGVQACGGLEVRGARLWRSLGQIAILTGGNSDQCLSLLIHLITTIRRKCPEEEGARKLT